MSAGAAPTTRSDFRAPWWLRSGHLQTLYAPLFRRRPALELSRERIELEDGDFVDLDFAYERPRSENGRRPLVLLLHGLEGSAHTAYLRSLVHTAHRAGLQAVVMHFRGCGGTPHRLQRSYHSGDKIGRAHV